MARVRLKPKRRVAEELPSPPPRKQPPPRVDPAEQAKRQRTMYQLALLMAPHEVTLAAMQREFPGISEEAVKRLRTQVEKAIASQTRDAVIIKRVKQEHRLLGHISAAKAKGAYGAVASLEREYSSVAGTAAPIRVQHEVSYDERFSSAFKRAVSQLTPEQAKGLLTGQVVPLGFTNDSAIDTTGEDADGQEE